MKTWLWKLGPLAVAITTLGAGCGGDSSSSEGTVGGSGIGGLSWTCG